MLFEHGFIDEYQLFQIMFSADSLEGLFKEKIARSTGKGLDRVNGFQFQQRAVEEFEVTSNKCRKGEYKFTPYLEVLKPKGRSKLPRLIGIPTVRDRVVLSQLNNFLATLYPERVPRNIASTYVRSIASELKTRDPETTWICSTDIKTFYDSIQRDRLLKVLTNRIKSKQILRLVRNALITPTVPKNTRRDFRAEYWSDTGIPQGLAISNILASIYLEDVDDAMKSTGIGYYRYVDDVLIYGSHNDVLKAYQSLSRRLKWRGLMLHSATSGKTHIQPLKEAFSYLGYHFVGHHITVRAPTVERFLQSIAAKFSDFSHNKSRRLEKFKYLNEERVASIFLMELNERITGAISEKKRYGWIAYFSQITDLTLLHKLDHAIAALFKRLAEFGNEAPAGLRTLRRSYWEMKFNPDGGYVRNYDHIVDRTQKLKLLEDRGRVGPLEALTDEQIDTRYEKYLSHVLSAMHADEGSVY